MDDKERQYYQFLKEGKWDTNVAEPWRMVALIDIAEQLTRIADALEKK